MPDSQRNTAVDVFRGITIALMIVVNNQGDWSHVYRPLRHAAWHGWLGADIVFPFFLFIMGVSVSLSYGTRIARGEERAAMLRKAAKRSAVLVALGLLINLFPNFDFAGMRIPGVLQRIGVCYLLAAAMYLYLGKRTRWVTAFALLAGYGIILKYLAPGGAGGDALSPAGNVCLAVDRCLLPGHTYQHAPVPGFDPEGILSTLGALASALAGTFAGDRLTKPGPARFSTKGTLLVAGALSLSAGLALGLWIPINKNLWTPSYAVFMAGMALVLLAGLHYIIGERKLTGWAKPFLALGMNAIAAYVLSSAAGKFLALVKFSTRAGESMSIKTMMFSALFASWLGPYAASLAWSLAFLLVWIGAMYALYRKNFFIKI